eukprot:8369796-Pyramimonas_sp.AAC.1
MVPEGQAARGPKKAPRRPQKVPQEAPRGPLEDPWRPLGGLRTKEAHTSSPPLPLRSVPLK